MLSDRVAIQRLINHPEWAPESYVSFIEGLRWLTSGQINGVGLSEIKWLPTLNLEQL